MDQEETSGENEQHQEEQNLDSECGQDQGHNPYSRVGKDSVDGWIKRKEEKRSKAASSGLARRTRLKSGKPLNKVSKKQKKRNNDYKKARETHYAEEANQRCAICGTTEGLSIHHKEKRGSNTANSETFITLCLTSEATKTLYPQLNHSHAGGCHGFCEANKAWARENGFLK